MKSVPKFSSDYRMVNAMRALAIIFLLFAAGSAWSFTVSGNTYRTNGAQSDVLLQLRNSALSNNYEIHSRRGTNRSTIDNTNG